MENKVISEDTTTTAPAKKVKRKNKPGMGKAKGNGFENTVAKKLSAALDPLKFIRTQGSGARVGGQNFETLGKMFGEDALKLFVGDVVPVNEKEAGVTFNFSVECKSYKSSDSFETMVAGNANIFKWMQESIDDAVKIAKIPLLIFKWNHTPIYVAGLREHMKQTPRLSLSQNERTIDIFYLDDLLETKHFWITEK
jgi:hypothetical protein